ncbi:MAG: bifunctional aspartate kinase/diaminopimelate decarboxylase [Deltaproteobacteria bacterium]|nr:bifunctional aspartate kinase/diaminopimelate decarboxylase [Deltaproteobacteria bacterium]
MHPGSRFVVLKFGGTSVSTAPNWANIAGVVRARIAEGLRPVIVHSALSKVTDSLERLLVAALEGRQGPVIEELEARHRSLAKDLGIEFPAGARQLLEELRQLAAGIALVREVSDRVRARVLASGELLATSLGAEYLQRAGISTRLVDARTVLKSKPQKGASEQAKVLSATCPFDPDPALIERFRSMDAVVLTQGFIASDPHGNTVLLGRGGSDTSGAYFAAKLSAARLEIWTDVPGMFTANPKDVPSARLLKALHYDEAQEIASNGAKVLHPRCILPVRQHDIPLYVFATQSPDLEGTVITSRPEDGSARVKAIALKKGITLVSMDSPGMWHQVGFLSDAFQVFKQHGLSVDLVSTSETCVTVSLDPQANSLDPQVLEGLVRDLESLCRVELIGPCASISLVGRNIRAILHELGESFSLFEEQRIYLLSQAANDLNLTIVIDESQGDRLSAKLHDLLIRSVGNDRVMGPTWEQLHATPSSRHAAPPWWHQRREALLELLDRRSSAYVYDRASIDANLLALRAMTSISRVLYSMKANPHPDVLRRVEALGFSFECVSIGEVDRLAETFSDFDWDRVLFTPNFAPREEYATALARGLRVTLDNAFVVDAWPELFAGRDVFVRVDTGRGHGHHRHVRTAGAHSKFGVPTADVKDLAASLASVGARVVGLHAHTGSGNFDRTSWVDTARVLSELAEGLPEVRVLDLGGGLGVPERSDQNVLDLAGLDRALGEVSHRRLEVWLEPGRYVIANAGVLVAKVTQLKGKGSVGFLGLATGMNSLIRPALYGAYHEIVNLTRLDEAPARLYEVVGPICESGDVLGHGRFLPEARVGDVMLIANAGAYGHAMSSSYNLRSPAEELVI